MAIHLTEDSMKSEALREMFEVVKYCIDFDKTSTWGYPGCYGYPAAILLLAIVEGIGAHVKGGGDDTKLHFEILNDPDWFNLNLTDPQIEVLRKGFRNKLTHQSVMAQGLMLKNGNPADMPVVTEGHNTILNLVPFFYLTVKMVGKLTPDLKTKIII